MYKRSKVQRLHGAYQKRKVQFEVLSFQLVQKVQVVLRLISSAL